MLAETPVFAQVELPFSQMTDYMRFDKYRVKDKAASKHETMTQCCFIIGRRLRRRPNINTTLGQCLVLAGHKGIVNVSCIVCYLEIHRLNKLNYCHAKTNSSNCLLFM